MKGNGKDCFPPKPIAAELRSRRAVELGSARRLREPAGVLLAERTLPWESGAGQENVPLHSESDIWKIVQNATSLENMYCTYSTYGLLSKSLITSYH